MNEKNYLPLAVLCVLVALGLRYWFTAAPELVPASAPKTVFSGARAFSMMEDFLREGVPHPVGSEENQRVKRRIQAWLDLQGIAHGEQKAWGCRKRECAYVENIIATLPGREAGPYVALMAHYDSVPAAPGAGDDMAGVVAVLETARAIQASGLTRKPIALLITDGEEYGLLGAAAFFTQHPLAKEIGVLLNVEGSGTRGPSGVLRTSSPNQWFMELLADVIAKPVGTSFAAEVFKRMPNDTDFSVADEAGVAGVDFAFSAERVHYHTPNDRVDILDPRTIQHHGDNIYPLALALANAQPPSTADLEGQGDVVYQNVFGQWLQWPARYSWLFLGLAAILLLADTLSFSGQKWRLFFASTIIPALALAAAAGGGYGAILGLEYLNGVTVPWPAHIWAFRLSVIGAAVLTSCLFAAIFTLRFSAHVLLLGAWWFVTLLVGLLLLLFSPAAGTFLVMLLPAALLLAVASWFPLPELLQKILRVATLAVPVLLLGAAYQSEEALGYGLILVPLVFGGLYLALATPFLRGPWLFVLGLVSVVALLVGAVSATMLPLYSEYRPQHANVRHYEDADTQQAYWEVRSDDAVPAPIAAVLSFNGPAVKLYPWESDYFDKVAIAAYEGLPPPELEVVTSVVKSTKSGGREVTLRMTSQRDSWAIALVVPEAAGLRTLRIGGAMSELAPPSTERTGSYQTLYLAGAPGKELLATLHFETTEAIDGYLLDYSLTLPHNGVVNARPAEASPVHNGDMSLLWKRVSF